jgi:hypothetical protein
MADSPTIFQITKEMVSHSSTLTKGDIGLWCFIYKGRYHGFTSTKCQVALIRKNTLEREGALRD